MLHQEGNPETSIEKRKTPSVCNLCYQDCLTRRTQNPNRKGTMRALLDKTSAAAASLELGKPAGAMTLLKKINEMG